MGLQGTEQNPDSIDIPICYLTMMVEFTRKLKLNILILSGKQGNNQASVNQGLPCLYRKKTNLRIIWFQYFFMSSRVFEV